MARHSMTINRDDLARRRVPEGEYPATISEVKFVLSRKANLPQVRIRLDLDGNGTMFQHLTIAKEAAGVLTQTLTSSGFVLPDLDAETTVELDDETLELFFITEDGEHSIDLKLILDARVTAVVGHNVTPQGTFDNIVAVRPLSDPDDSTDDDEDS